VYDDALDVIACETERARLHLERHQVEPQVA
jgi:hypothetical protein